ncbi:uracil-DNA glycosylase [Lysinibacillus xylanilyticus]|uniref:uracil-DNA glycosylase n=1 Tax=Lysinibacillus xylanilyticus TaxID=582475 RepID=UPI00380D5751
MLPNNIHASWKPFITEDILNELKLIEMQIGENYNPVNKEDILRFLKLDLDSIKIIWLGQDVYPAKGVATGRAFEVGTLSDWSDKFRQVSLKNIIRLIHKNYTGIEEYNEIKKFSEIQKEIQNMNFRLKEPKDLFNSLEKQGVMFLNTSFTCEIGKPNSHKLIWKKFSIKVMEYIAENNSDIIWFLWGNEAIANKAYINAGNFFESRHPMMCSEKYDEDFLKFEGFKATMNKINWLG